MEIKCVRCGDELASAAVEYCKKHQYPPHCYKCQESIGISRWHSGTLIEGSQGESKIKYNELTAQQVATIEINGYIQSIKEGNWGNWDSFRMAIRKAESNEVSPKVVAEAKEMLQNLQGKTMKDYNKVRNQILKNIKGEFKKYLSPIAKKIDGTEHEMHEVILKLDDIESDIKNIVQKGFSINPYVPDLEFDQHLQILEGVLQDSLKTGFVMIDWDEKCFVWMG